LRLILPSGVLMRKMYEFFRRKFISLVQSIWIVVAHCLRCREGKKREINYQRLDPEEINKIWNEHWEWVKSNGTAGLRAEVVGADLRNAPFWMINLEGANLMDCDLRGTGCTETNFSRANLSRTDFQGAALSYAIISDALLPETDFKGAKLASANLSRSNLSSANFESAILSEAQFEGAWLYGASFRNAILEHAKLKFAKGLSAKQFAGAYLVGAELSDELGGFKGLEHVARITDIAMHLFNAMLLGCIYCWLTIANTTDVKLLTDSITSPLPIIQTEIPIAGFYLVAPLILFGIYIWLHLYLQRLWENVAELPAVFPDGRSLDQRIHPWLVNGIIRAHVPLLKQKRPALLRVQVTTSRILVWWLVPFTLGWIWTRYLVRHDWVGSIEHSVVLVVSIVFAVAVQRLAKNTLEGKGVGPSIPYARQMLEEGAQSPEAPTKFPGPWVQVLRWGCFGGVLLILAIGISDIAINAVEDLRPRERELQRFLKDVRVQFKTAYVAENNQDRDVVKDYLERGRHLAPRLLHSLGIRYAAELGEQELSILAKNVPLEERVALDSVKAAQLRNADMRNANARDAYWVKADMRGANLKAADLRGGLFKRADLRGASLSLADLSDADLAQANLEGAVLDDARVVNAGLQGANLSRVRLRRAELFQAQLQGADLRDADLEEADLRGVDLTNVKNLTQDQLEFACTDNKTKFPEGMKLSANCPKDIAKIKQGRLMQDLKEMDVLENDNTSP